MRYLEKQGTSELFRGSKETNEVFKGYKPRRKIQLS